MKKTLILIPALALTVVLGGCNMNKTAASLGMECKTLTTIGGAGAGAAVGAFFGKGTGNLLAIGGGAVLGGILGNQFSDSLGCDEQEKLTEATGNVIAQPVGASESWQTANASGTVTTMSPFVVDQGNACRTVRQTAKLKNGKTIEEDRQLCRPASGWISPPA